MTGRFSTTTFSRTKGFIVGKCLISVRIRNFFRYRTSEFGRVLKTSSAYDRWERRRSVASQGDRIRLFQASRLGIRSDVQAPPIQVFESYDYEVMRSQLRFEEEAVDAARVDKDMVAESLMRGLAPIVIGVCVGLAAVVSGEVAMLLVECRWQFTEPLLNSAPSDNPNAFEYSGVLKAFPIFVGFAMLLTAFAAALTTKAPAAAGSGIPQVKAELNGVRVPGALSVRTMAVKIIGVTLVVASGLPCGREGPMVQLGVRPPHPAPPGPRPRRRDPMPTRCTQPSPTTPPYHAARHRDRPARRACIHRG